MSNVIGSEISVRNMVALFDQHSEKNASSPISQKVISAKNSSQHFVRPPVQKAEREPYKVVAYSGSPVKDMAKKFDLHFEGKKSSPLSQTVSDTEEVSDTEDSSQYVVRSPVQKSEQESRTGTREPKKISPSIAAKITELKASSSTANKIKVIHTGSYGVAAVDESKYRHEGQTYNLYETLRKVTDSGVFFQPAKALNPQGTQYCGIAPVKNTYSLSTTESRSSPTAALAGNLDDTRPNTSSSGSIDTNARSEKILAALESRQHKQTTLSLNKPLVTADTAHAAVTSSPEYPFAKINRLRKMEFLGPGFLVNSNSGSASTSAAIETPPPLPTTPPPVQETSRPIEFTAEKGSAMRKFLNTMLSPSGSSTEVSSGQLQKVRTETPPPLSMSQPPVQQKRSGDEIFENRTRVLPRSRSMDDAQLGEKWLKNLWPSEDSGIDMRSDGSVSDNQAEADDVLSHSVANKSLTHDAHGDDALDVSPPEMEWDSSGEEDPFSKVVDSEVKGIYHELDELLTAISQLKGSN